MPKSVSVLDSKDESDYDGVWCLHFKISPNDFKLILASTKWEIVSEPPIEADCEWGYEPQSLGNNVITYSYIPFYNGIEVMLTNYQMNEVYFYAIDSNTR